MTDLAPPSATDAGAGVVEILFVDAISDLEVTLAGPHDAARLLDRGERPPRSPGRRKRSSQRR